MKMSWHVPSEETIDFALQIFKELVEPTLGLLEDLMKPGLVRDAVWRNDFCRCVQHASRNGCDGIDCSMLGI